MGEDLVADARRAVARHAWRDAAACYRRVSAPLAAADLQDWALAAHLVGEADVAEDAWSRAYHGWQQQGAHVRAVRCAFWLGLTLLLAGEHARAGGWFARAAHLLTTRPDPGGTARLRLPEALAALSSGRAEEALAEFEQIAGQAEGTADPELATLAHLGQGQAEVALGRVRPGLASLDEAMLAVVSGEVSPLVAGIVYCAVILTCRDAFDVPRAQQWTAALSQWCEHQQGIRPYRGQCLVHRSELLQLRGRWREALVVAEEARAHLADLPRDPAQGMACYQLGELLRLRGEHDRAEAAYREAGTWGHPVHPGLALLRLAQGRTVAADRALGAALAVATDRATRLRLLPAGVEVALAAGHLPTARRYLHELVTLADGADSELLRAATAHAAGRVLLAEGHAEAAAGQLQAARSAWLALDAPYETGRASLDLAAAYRALGDAETARLEQDAAAAQLGSVGATAELARLTGPGSALPTAAGHPLTGRQLEVLTQVAAGATNRQIATRLSISEHTVRRHLQNIYTTLDLGSRAAATAWAYRHGLLPPQ